VSEGGVSQHLKNKSFGYGVTKSACVFELRRDKVRLRILIMYYVYSLKCRDGFYVGCTDNLDSRLIRHQKGQVEATKNRLPVNLEFYFAIIDKYKAYKLEKYFKSGSGRAFIKRHLSLN